MGEGGPGLGRSGRSLVVSLGAVRNRCSFELLQRFSTYGCDKFLLGLPIFFLGCPMSSSSPDAFLFLPFPEGRSSSPGLAELIWKESVSRSSTKKPVSFCEGSIVRQEGGHRMSQSSPQLPVFGLPFSIRDVMRYQPGDWWWRKC